MPPTMRVFDSFAASTFLALIRDIIANRVLVSPGVCQSTSDGSSSIRYPLQIGHQFSHEPVP